MRSIWKHSGCCALALAAVLSFSGCGRTARPVETRKPEPIVLPTPTVPTETVAANPYAGIETLKVVMDPGDLYTLTHYPDLKSVDLSGSTCYGPILDFMEKHPELEITFTVDLGGSAVSVKETDLTLSPGQYQYDALVENLQYLPELKTLALPQVNLDAGQLHALMEAYPRLAISYTQEILGITVDADTRELDLSAMTSGQLGEAMQKLGMLANVKTVKLSSSLSRDEVDQLQAAAPHIVFDYSFSLFGQTISTAQEEIIFKKQDIGNEGEGEIREALKLLEHCQRFVLDDCGLDYEVLAKIREDFRGGPKVVWRVRFGVGNRYTTVTDDDVIRAVKNVTDETCGPMKYLEDVVHMDLGHNDTLSDLSFVGYMPKLETLIVSGCSVNDISGFENCKNLKWLELAYCAKLKDISPLAGCENLAYLNLSFTGVSDYTPLDALPLERFVCLSPKVSTEAQNAFIAAHPKEDCITVFYGQKNPYSYGWRYDDYGKTMFWYYKDVIRKVFNYDQADAILDAQKKAEGN